VPNKIKVEHGYYWWHAYSFLNGDLKQQPKSKVVELKRLPPTSYRYFLCLLRCVWYVKDNARMTFFRHLIVILSDNLKRYIIRATNYDIMSVAKIVELVGSSEKGWEDAAQAAVNEAMKTLRGIRGIEIVGQTAQVDSKTGKITKYRTCVKMSFGIESK
jgi:dodecin